jgi:hypothetical protein
MLADDNEVESEWEFDELGTTWTITEVSPLVYEVELI